MSFNHFSVFQKTPEQEWQTANAIQRIRMFQAMRKMYGVSSTNDIPDVLSKLFQNTYGASRDEVYVRTVNTICDNIS